MVKSKAWYLTFSITVLLVLAPSCGYLSDDITIIDLISRKFEEQNPKLDEVRILDIKSATWEHFSDYIFLVHAVRADHKFEGDFDDEQYGLFLVDARFTTIKKVVDMFSSPRWLDYQVKISRVESLKVFIEGQGESYGDNKLSRTYDLNAR